MKLSTGFGDILLSMVLLSIAAYFTVSDELAFNLYASNSQSLSKSVVVWFSVAHAGSPLNKYGLAVDSNCSAPSLNV